MTISSNDRRYEYEGGTGTLIFTGPRAFNATHVEVFVVDKATQVATKLTNYTINGVGAKAKKTAITLVDPVPAGSVLQILRTVPIEQNTDITNQGAYLPEVVEDAADKIVQQVQQLADTADRSLRLADNVVGVSSVLKDFKPLMPVVVNADGSGFTVGDTELTGDMALRGNLASPETGKGAGLVKFKQKGAGAIERWVDEKLFEVPSVNDFGAVGDGTADDRASVLALKAAHGIVRFTKGVYKIASGMTLDCPVVFEEGASITVPTGVTVAFAQGYSLRAQSKQIFYGPGSVTGLWEARPEWFGAPHNDADDDTAAIRKAVNSLASGLQAGGTLTLSAENYLTDGTAIQLPVGVSVRGAGRVSTVIRVLGSTSKLWELSTGNVISDMSILKAGAAATSGGMVSNWDAGGATLKNTIKDVFIQGAWDGISIKTTAGWNIDGYIAFNCLRTAIRCEDVGDIYLSNFLFTGNPSEFADGAIRLYNHVEAFIATTGDVIGGVCALFCDAAVNALGARPAYNHFTNVFFDSASAGAQLYKSVVMRFTSCWFSNRPAAGCNVGGGCDDVSFANCEFINNGGHGLHIMSGSSNVRVNGCSVISNSGNAYSAYHGISVDPGVCDFIITGCVVKNGLGIPSSQGFGILVNSGASDRYVIADNLVSGNVGAGVNDGGTGANKRVAGNF